jgi:hypothetical protein
MDEKQPFMSNFAMIIPQGPFVEPKKKPISRRLRVLCFLIGHKWGFAGITYEGPSFPRKCSRCKKKKWFDKPTLRMRFAKWATATLDKIWPFCRIGLHLYKSHYGFQSFSYGPGSHEPPVKQHIYKCSCCNKIKIVTL